MTKQAIKSKSVLAVAIVLMFVLVFAGIGITAMSRSTKSADAADYSYDADRDGATLDPNGDLTVTFCVEYGVSENGGSMIKWVVYLFDPDRAMNYSYNSDHKYDDSVGMGRNTADYYFMTDNDTDEGRITVTIPADAPAYSGGPQDTSSETDYLNYAADNKTLDDVMSEKNWKVSIGPFWNSPWASKGKSYNVDYYVGDANNIIAASLIANGTFTFYDYDGTQLADASNSIVPPSSPSRTGYIFDGWYCDTTKSVYTAAALNGMDPADVRVDGGANFYATYKKTDATGDYIEFTSSVVSATGDYVDDNGNVSRPYDSVNNMDYVTVRYDITHNTGVNNLLVVLDYDTTAFSLSYGSNETLADVISFADTALGAPTFNNDDAHSIVWDKSGEAFSSLKNNFFTVRYTINKEAVVSEKDYYFGVKIYPYSVNASSIANRFDEGEGLGEQVDVPVTQIVKKFTPVVRQAATITIGGNLDDDDMINPLERFYSGTYANTAFSALKVEQLPAIDDEGFDFIVRYTYNGDATTEITWMSFVDGSNYKEDRTYQYSAISAPQEPGRYMVMITAPETLKYYAAGPAFCEISINKIDRNISIEDKSHIYGGTPSTPLYVGSTSGITFSAFATTQADEPQTVTLSDATDVGVYDIRYTLAFDAVHYNVFINGILASAGTAVDSGFDYRVLPKEVAFTIDNKSHTYGDTPASLTVSGGESGISCTAYIAKNSEEVALSSTTTAGTYDIMYTLTASTALTNYTITMNGNIVVTSTGDTGSDYTVNKKTIWLKAMDQTHTFTGENVAISTGSNRYFFYSNEGCTQIYDTANLLDFDATKITLFYVDEYGDPTDYSAMGDYENAIRAIYAPVPEKIDPNHEIREKRGNLSIRGTTADYFYQFFETTDRMYNSDGQVVIATKDGVTLPEWITSIGFKTSGNDEFQTDGTLSDGASYSEVNAATYYFDVKLTFSDASYFNGQDSYVIISDIDEDEAKHLRATISPAAVTLKPDDAGHTYGNTPATLTYTATEGTVYTGDDVNVSYTVKDGNEENVTLSAATPVGAYTISMAASNSNYVISTQTGTYTVSAGTVNMFFDVYDIKYNRKTGTELIQDLIAHKVKYNEQDELNTRATVGSIDLVDDATFVLYDSNNEEVGENVVLPIGTYKMVMTVPASDNYTNNTLEKTFTVFAIHVHDPEVTYDGNKVIITPYTYPTQDVADIYGRLTDEDNWALYDESLLTVTVNGTTLTGVNGVYTYTATSLSDGFSYSVGAGDNYLPAEGTTKAVYAATFVKGDVTDWTGYPQTIYAFEDEAVIIPENVPVDADDAKNFSGWEKGGASYAAGDSVTMTQSFEFTAVWGLQKYIITFKYYAEAETANTDVFTKEVSHGYTVALPTMSPEHPEVIGKTYVHNNTWSDGENTYGVSGGVLTLNSEEFHVTEALTLIAQYTITENGYTITYYFSDNEATTYPQEPWKVTENLHYGDTIAYDTFDGANYAWFIKDAWYSDAERTQVAPTTMPAESITVYGSYKFDIGMGDVNASGAVTTDDIALYRQWIVGGYEMTVVEAGTEWALVTGNDYNGSTIYFVKRVADINVDDSKDIRDVSITRMALVGGYTWDVVTGESVTGAEIVRAQKVGTYATLTAWLENHERVSLIDNIESVEDFAVETAGNVVIDLCGNTLTVNSMSLYTSGANATITIKNGTIVTADGVTLRAPNGNVVIENVTAYDGNGIINLQAANSSLHFDGTVAFYRGGTSSETPASVMVAEGTHVVVESAATLTIEDVKVATVANNGTFQEDETKVITMENKTETPVEVKGIAVNEIRDLSGLIRAGSIGGEYVLASDITYNGTLSFTKDTVIDLNGHTLKSNNDVALAAREGATLTIKGNGNVEAQEACVMAFDGSAVVINGGSYTAIDNFVFGTNGTAGRGNNTITVNAGTFNGNITSAGYVACGVYVANNDTVVINGGTFNVTNGVGILARSGNTTVGADVVFNVTGDGHLGKVGDSKVTVPAGEALVLDLKANYPGGDPTLTNETSYGMYALVENLTELVSVMNKASKIKLFGDMAYSGTLSFTKDTVLCLNGHTLRSTDAGALAAREGATLTIEGNGNVYAQEYCVMAFDGSKNVINGGTYTAIDNFVFGTNGTAGRGNNTITVNAGTFNGNITSAGYVACGVYVANNDTVVINGGTFNVTNGVGILARSGNTTVGADVVFNVTGDGHLGKVGDSKVTVPAGEALVLDLKANYPGGVPTLTNNNTGCQVYEIK